MSEKLWEPSQEQINNSNMTRYMNYLKEKNGLEFEAYDELYEWSVANMAEFWASLWDFFQLIHSKPYETVLENPEDMLASRWFRGARLNYAENLLRFRDDSPALVFRSEHLDRNDVVMSYNELYHEVSQLARALRKEGVGVGDRVVGYLPNMNETVAAMLAGASCGAIWSSCSPDFGFQGVLDRFGQIRPKVLFTVDGYFYNGKEIDLLPRISEILSALPSIEKVVVVPYVDPGVDILGIPNSILYDAFKDSAGEKGAGEKIEFEQLPFDHPLYILYSSGTTGVPKCMVHGAGNALLRLQRAAVEHP